MCEWATGFESGTENFPLPTDVLWQIHSFVARRRSQRCSVFRARHSAEICHPGCLAAKSSLVRLPGYPRCPRFRAKDIQGTLCCRHVHHWARQYWMHGTFGLPWCAKPVTWLLPRTSGKQTKHLLVLQNGNPESKTPKEQFTIIHHDHYQWIMLVTTNNHNHQLDFKQLWFTMIIVIYNDCRDYHPWDSTIKTKVDHGGFSSARGHPSQLHTEPELRPSGNRALPGPPSLDRRGVAKWLTCTGRLGSSVKLGGLGQHSGTQAGWSWIFWAIPCGRVDWEICFIIGSWLISAVPINTVVVIAGNLTNWICIYYDNYDACLLLISIFIAKNMKL